MAKDDKKPGFKTKGVSLHTSVLAKLKQLSSECAVGESLFISDLIKNYGQAQRKKYLPDD